jgi:UDP-2,3-diacylglucosamine pyrophosphatase LpxH
VVNGDTVDFMHIDLRPEPQAPRLGLETEERLYGLAYDEERARWKLEAVCRYHRRVLRALCRFIEAGNTCVFVVGNHDVELGFELVRHDLVEHIARHSSAPDLLRERISFTDWFYYEQGRAYVEHGHRFDPYATFPDPLVPFDLRRPTRIAPSFSHVALRFFANRVRTLPIHDLDLWTAGDFMRWARTRAGMSLPGLFGRFIATVVRYGREATADRITRWRDRARFTAARVLRLQTIARMTGLPFDVLRALDALRRPAIGTSLLRLAQAFYVDRLGLVALLAAGLFIAWSWVKHTSLQLALDLALGVGVVQLWRVLGRLRPSPDCHPSLGGVARAIARHTGARVVVFGHTHRPTEGDVETGVSRWLNPGSWEHLHRRRPHRAGETCRCGLGYALVTGPAEAPEARLMYWCRTHRRPNPNG